MAEKTAEQLEFNDIIGLSIPDAEKKVRQRGIETIRATVRDGEPQIVTMDISSTRLNVATKGGQIVSISGVR